MKWYEGLENFVKDYPNSPDSAEAMFQLANAREMSGRESDATKWYSQIVSKFPQTPQAVKSKGALYRLSSVGKQMQLKGVTSNNKALDIAKFKEYNVIVYYWSATSSSAQSDVLALKAAKEKYGSKLQIIGVNLDNNPEQMTQFVEQNNIGWYQIDGKVYYGMNTDGLKMPKQKGLVIMILHCKHRILCHIIVSIKYKAPITHLYVSIPVRTIVPVNIIRIVAVRKDLRCSH